MHERFLATAEIVVRLKGGTYKHMTCCAAGDTPERAIAQLNSLAAARCQPAIESGMSNGELLFSSHCKVSAFDLADSQVRVDSLMDAIFSNIMVSDRPAAAGGLPGQEGPPAPEAPWDDTNPQRHPWEDN